MEDFSFSFEDFSKYLRPIIEVSNSLLDGWRLETKTDRDNGEYIIKKVSKYLSNKATNQELLSMEYHVAYHISYGVPILCFNAWKQDGSLLTLEEYWKSNEKLKDFNMLETLTQMDHPVLCRPFLTMHPCKTQEIMHPFLKKSKNPLVSWLSVMGPFVDLQLLDDYIKCCT